jgi:hypothetical protein
MAGLVAQLQTEEPAMTPQISWDRIDDLLHLGCVAADLSDKNIKFVRAWFDQHRPDRAKGRIPVFLEPVDIAVAAKYLRMAANKEVGAQAFSSLGNVANALELISPGGP